MRLAPDTRRKRAGFTLLEILVVVVIILILAGLISGAAYRGLSKAREVRNRSDISQLSIAVENFKTRFGSYPPSRVILCEDYREYFLGNNPASGQYKTQLHQDSFEFINRIFPRINWSWTSPSQAWKGIDWNQDGLPTAGDQGLEGEQCLVFFLGGMVGPGPQLLGFSTNSQNPMLPGGDRIGPFYEFQTGRLGVWPGTLAPYLSYLDYYGNQPYAYFSSYKAPNNYNRWGGNDCPSLLKNLVPPVSAGLVAYFDAPGRFINPNSFQIISAGKDGFFGPGGGVWTPANASSFYPDPSIGRDDQSNFYDSPLGIETK
jgi:general secretion pathway protein G